MKVQPFSVTLFLTACGKTHNRADTEVRVNDEVVVKGKGTDFEIPALKRDDRITITIPSGTLLGWVDGVSRDDDEVMLSLGNCIWCGKYGGLMRGKCDVGRWSLDIPGDAHVETSASDEDVTWREYESARDDANNEWLAAGIEDPMPDEQGNMLWAIFNAPNKIPHLIEKAQIRRRKKEKKRKQEEKENGMVSPF